MNRYTAPLADLRFALHDVLGAAALYARLPGCEAATRDVIDAVLEEGAKFAEQVLAPLNQSGDEEGCRFESGVVRTPNGFQDAYRLFRDGGWTALACDPAYGGQGLPQTLNLFVEEMVSSANLSFGMYPGLAHGAYRAIHRHGSEEQKRRFLPPLVDGRWGGTMCLTEPHCGTDLGQIGAVDRVVRRESDGMAKLFDGRLEPARLVDDQPENMEGLGVCRIQLEDVTAG